MSQLGPVPEGRVSDRLVDAEDLLVPKWRWNELARLAAVIGTCRKCGAEMYAVESDEHDAAGEVGQVTWYEARCARGHEVASPNGRVLRRSGLHSEMPSKWWAAREERDRELAEASDQKPGS